MSLIEHHAMQTYRIVAVHCTFLTSTVDTFEWSVSRPGRSDPSKEFRYSLDTRLKGLQRRSACSEQQKNPYPCSHSNPNYPARGLLSIMTELHRSLIYINLHLRFMGQYNHKDFGINWQSFGRGYLQLYDKYFTDTNFSCRVACVFSLWRFHTIQRAQFRCSNS